MNGPDDFCGGPEEYLWALNRKVARERIPISGTYDPTHRCNLRCLHCYAGPAAPADREHHELTTAQAFSVIDQVVDAGCLFLLISGGEPLVRPDFADIYVHARQKGLLLTLFTNGTLVDEHIADLLAEWVPRTVEISIYGATAATHDRVTGHAGSFEQAWNGIGLLCDRRVNVRLKTILMTVNAHEYHDMEAMAHGHGCGFRCDPAIFPRFSGDRSPLLLRIPARKAAELELSDPETTRRWKAYYERVRELPWSDRLYQCGAGVGSFYVDPYGVLQPCLMTRDIRYNMVGGSFAEGWRDVSSRIAAKRGSPADRCLACKNRALCGYCPAYSMAETGNENAVSTYLCELGESRYNEMVKAEAGTIP